MFKTWVDKVIRKKDDFIIKYLLSDKKLLELQKSYQHLKEEHGKLEKKQEEIDRRLHELNLELDYLKKTDYPKIEE